VRRREFIALFGCAAVGWPIASLAQQQPKPLRVGIASLANQRSAQPFVAFDQRLSELGYVDGQDIIVEFIGLEGHIDRMSEAMRELVRRQVNIIVAFGPEIALRAAIAASTSIPIVMVAIDYDPLARGYVTSLARPGGNITGVFLQQIDLARKRIEFLSKAFPDLRSATVFWDLPSADQWRAAQEAGRAVGLRLAGAELRELPYDYEGGLAQAPADHRNALIVMNSPIFFRDRERLAQFALQHRIPSMFAWREWVDAGGLISYGPSFTGIARRTAEYVDRIGRGAKPAELPIEQPTNFELVVNLKTAKVLGLTIPPSLLARADEVIE
jgi:putative tryptophan/tyrosine transport system substrate-binding protein